MSDDSKYIQTEDDIQNPCEICGQPYDGDKPMVCCDSCNAWYHVHCAKLKSIPDKSEEFFCSRCKIQATRQQKKLSKKAPLRVKQPSLDDNTTPINTNSNEETRKLSERLQSMETKFAQRELEMKKLIDDMKKERSVHQKIMAEKEATIRKLQSDLNDSRAKNLVTSGNSSELPSSQTNILTSVDHSNLNETVKELVFKFMTENKVDDDAMSRCSSGSQHSNVESYAIKQAIMDLPHFSGDPREWPAFISAYRGSNEQVKFHNYENLARLNKSLSGDALLAVEGYLMHPNLIDKAIDELESLYGNPNLVKRSLELEVLNSDPPQEADPNSIVRYAIKVRNHICYLKTLNDCENQLKNQETLTKFLKRLSSNLQVRWYEMKNVMMLEPTLEHFDNWLSGIARNYRDVSINNGGVVLHSTQSSNKKQAHSLNIHSKRENPGVDEQHEVRRMSCYCCKESTHRLPECKEFQELLRYKKFQFLKRNNLCFTCLKKNHSWKKCYQNQDKVEPQMHELLKEEENVENSPKKVVDACLSHYSVRKQRKTIFRVIPITIHVHGKCHHTYAMLDDCSSITLIDEKFANTIGLPITDTRVPVTLQWTQGKISDLLCNTVTAHVSGCKRDSKIYKLRNVHTVPELNLPNQTINADALKERYSYLNQTEIRNLMDVCPLVLIGLEHTKLGTPLKVVEGGFNQPVAYKTRLGWTVHGPDVYETKTTVHPTFLMCICGKSDEILHDMIRFSFTTESFGVKPPGEPMTSVNDARAIKLLENKTQKIENRYIAPLLWERDHVTLPDSKQMAYKRLKSLERRLDNDSELKRLYRVKIHDYMKKNYAKKLNSEELKAPVVREWFLPHFPVTNPSKPGKVRIVMDAAARVKGKSLNSYLLSGPDIYTSIISVLWNFRLFMIAIVGDIEEMFLQVEITKEDQPCQRFLWRDCNPNKEPEIYQLQRMTFGATSSPFTAQWIKNENARRNIEKYPEAYSSIVNCHYVDDYLESFPTIQRASEVVTQVQKVHSIGGFKIGKFMSNSQKLLELLGQKNGGEDVLSLQSLEKQLTEKVLGIHWNQKTDEMVFHVNYLEKLKMGTNTTPTKREFLRILMSIFDPHGLIGNYTICGKIILQNVWKSGIGWDEKLRQLELNKYRIWIVGLEEIKKFSIPRCMSLKIPGAEAIELHVFTDASDSAFATICYLRVRKFSDIDISIIGSKTRVAPTKKTLSIPRLELQGFILGLRWARTIIKGLHQIKINNIFHWTDSSTVLSWMQSETRRYSIFVEHRVSEALDYFEEYKNASFRYVPTGLNAADLATKWPKQFDVSPSSVWIKGPKFLQMNEKFWPQEITRNECDEEMKLVYLHGVIKHGESPLFEFQRYSSFHRLVVVAKLVVVAASKWKKLLKLEKPDVNGTDYSAAKLLVIKIGQWEMFKEEIHDLKMKKVICPNSKIYNLTPYLDEESGLLRVGGRISKANFVEYDTKFPMILQNDHPLTSLIIDEYHKKFAHQHLESCVNELRRKYWIPHLRTAVKQSAKRCQFCLNRKVQPVPPQMGQLPATRFGPYMPPFTYTGMDLFGPVEVTVRRSREKRWVVVYTCLVVRAVHMELVSSLSTDACIMAYKNFTNTRIRPRVIHCDNGTNFVGMNKELKAAWQEIKANREKLNMATRDSTMNYQTEFVFNPPTAAHMGGIWERLVRTIKSVLFVLLKEKAPKEETLRCFLLETMNIVNSRPLTYLPTNDVMEPALTPNSFLKLTCNADATPMALDDDHYMNGRKQWRIVEQLSNHFWRRWIKEYLPELTRRTKWFKKSKPLEINDIVLIVDPNADRASWEKGRVTKTYPDKSGQVRYADIKTETAVRPKRPVVKLAKLDIVKSGENS